MPGECLSRGLLCDCEILAKLRLKLYPVHPQVDSPRRDGLEGVLLEALDIVVVEVEIIDGKGVIEHVLGHGGDEVLAQVELVQPLLVAEVKKIFFKHGSNIFFKFC